MVVKPSVLDSEPIKPLHDKDGDEESEGDRQQSPRYFLPHRLLVPVLLRNCQLSILSSRVNRKYTRNEDVVVLIVHQSTSYRSIGCFKDEYMVTSWPSSEIFLMTYIFSTCSTLCDSPLKAMEPLAGGVCLVKRNC